MGNGSFGVVFQATCFETGDTVSFLLRAMQTGSVLHIMDMASMSLNIVQIVRSSHARVVGCNAQIYGLTYGIIDGCWASQGSRHFQRCQKWSIASVDPKVLQFSY